MLVGKYTGTTIKLAASSKIKDLLLCYLREVPMHVQKEAYTHMFPAALCITVGRNPNHHSTLVVYSYDEIPYDS